MANAHNLTPFTPDNAAEVGARGGHAKKGKKHISTWIQDLLEDEEFTATIQEGYKVVEYKGAPIKAIVRAQAVKALNGDSKAFDMLGKYGWGVKNETDLTIKALPKPLLEGLDELSGNDSNSQDSSAQ